MFKYNFYERKDELISVDQLAWINNNIESISNKENILFVFQAEYEALLFTNLGIYFPNRDTKRLIRYEEILRSRIAGDVLIELKTTNSEVYSIILVTSVDKVKIFQVLNILIKNYKDSKDISFEDIDNIFEKFTVLKYPLNQLQHKLPQVYLKQFGYLERDQWKISIIQRGEKFTRQKSIGSFTGETNIFDIESEDDRFPRMFETLNADLENLYPEVLNDIFTNLNVSDNSWEILVQLTPNLMVRSDYWRTFVRGILESEKKEAFLDITLSIHTNSLEELKELKNKYFYKIISDSELSRSTINKTLLHFLNYVFHHLRSLDLIILKAPKGKEFFTSDNPVVFNANQLQGKLGLFAIDTELYFPICKDYLAYFHYKESKKEFPLRKLKNRGIYNVEDVLTQKQYDHIIRKEIISNSDKLIIVPGKMEYKIEK
jgi:hypothetical protein